MSSGGPERDRQRLREHCTHGRGSPRCGEILQVAGQFRSVDGGARLTHGPGDEPVSGVGRDQPSLQFGVGAFEVTEAVLFSELLRALLPKSAGDFDEGVAVGFGVVAGFASVAVPQDDQDEENDRANRGGSADDEHEGVRSFTAKKHAHQWSPTAEAGTHPTTGTHSDGDGVGDGGRDGVGDGDGRDVLDGDGLGVAAGVAVTTAVRGYVDAAVGRGVRCVDFFGCDVGFGTAVKGFPPRPLTCCCKARTRSLLPLT